MEKLFEYIEEIAKISSFYPNEEPVRALIRSKFDSMKRKYWTDDFGNLYLLPKRDSKILLSAHMDKQAPPNYEDLGRFIVGKLDDAIGIGIILTLAKELDFHAFFSVGEEGDNDKGGLRGSQYALDNNTLPKVVNAIVIDTSQFGEPENGPVFYTSFQNKNPSDEFLSKIFKSAELMGVNLQPREGYINDGVNLIKVIPNTIALEPHIDNNHTSEEKAAKKDIIDIYRVIKKYFELEKKELKK